MSAEILAAIAADRQAMAKKLYDRVEYERCDCGCPQGRSPASGRDVGVQFAARKVETSPIDLPGAADRDQLIEAAKRLLRQAGVMEWMIDRRLPHDTTK